MAIFFNTNTLLAITTIFVSLLIPLAVLIVDSKDNFFKFDQKLLLQNVINIKYTCISISLLILSSVFISLNELIFLLFIVGLFIFIRILGKIIKWIYDYDDKQQTSYRNSVRIKYLKYLATNKKHYPEALRCYQELFYQKEKRDALGEEKIVECFNSLVDGMYDNGLLKNYYNERDHAPKDSKLKSVTDIYQSILGNKKNMSIVLSFLINKSKNNIQVDFVYSNLFDSIFYELSKVTSLDTFDNIMYLQTIIYLKSFLDSLENEECAYFIGKHEKYLENIPFEKALDEAHKFGIEVEKLGKSLNEIFADFNNLDKKEVYKKYVDKGKKSNLYDIIRQKEERGENIRN